MFQLRILVMFHIHALQEREVCVWALRLRSGKQIMHDPRDLCASSQFALALQTFAVVTITGVVFLVEQYAVW